MSLARVTLKGPPSARGVRNEPLATGGDPLPQHGGGSWRSRREGDGGKTTTSGETVRRDLTY